MWKIPQLMKLLLDRVGIVEAGHAQGQLHFTRVPADSVWSTSYKTEWMVLRGYLDKQGIGGGDKEHGEISFRVKTSSVKRNICYIDMARVGWA